MACPGLSALIGAPPTDIFGRPKTGLDAFGLPVSNVRGAMTGRESKTREQSTDAFGIARGAPARGEADADAASEREVRDAERDARRAQFDEPRKARRRKQADNRARLRRRGEAPPLRRRGEPPKKTHKTWRQQREDNEMAWSAALRDHKALKPKGRSVKAAPANLHSGYV